MRRFFRMMNKLSATPKSERTKSPQRRPRVE